VTIPWEKQAKVLFSVSIGDLELNFIIFTLPQNHISNFIPPTQGFKINKNLTLGDQNLNSKNI
jgi:hypothetical protein